MFGKIPLMIAFPSISCPRLTFQLLETQYHFKSRGFNHTISQEWIDTKVNRKLSSRKLTVIAFPNDGLLTKPKIATITLSFPYSIIRIISVHGNCFKQKESTAGLCAGVINDKLSYFVYN